VILGGLLLEESLIRARMPNGRDLDGRQPHQGPANARPRSFHSTLVGRVASTLSYRAGLDHGQAPDALWGDEAVRNRPAASPSRPGRRKRTLSL
jgi:hypothetical protein